MLARFPFCDSTCMQSNHLRDLILYKARINRICGLRLAAIEIRSVLSKAATNTA